MSGDQKIINNQIKTFLKTMIHPHLSGYSKSANNTLTIAEPTTNPNPTPTIQGVKDATHKQ